MRAIATSILFVWIAIFSYTTHANTLDRLAKELQPAEPNNTNHQKELAEHSQQAIQWQNEYNTATQRIEHLQQTINDYPRLSAELNKKINTPEPNKKVPSNLPIIEYEQLITQVSSQLLELNRRIQQEQDRTRQISQSLNQLPQQQVDIRKKLDELNAQINDLSTTSKTPLAQAKLSQLQSEREARKAQLNAFELDQLSVNNRLELSRLQTHWLKQQYDFNESYIQVLRDTLNNQRQKETEKTLSQTQLLVQQTHNLPEIVNQLLQINQTLSVNLNQQAQKLEQISQQQTEVAHKIRQIRQTIATIREQSNWLTISTSIGEIIRDQLAKLPATPKPQALDNQLVELRLKHLHYERLSENARTILNSQQDKINMLSAEQKILFNQQFKKEQELLSSLLSGNGNLILELTKLKVANNQLVEALAEVSDVTHRHLFWTADIEPINFSYPLELIKNFNRFISLDTFTQLSQATLGIFTHLNSLFFTFVALALVLVSIYSRKYYNDFLLRVNTKIGKVTQDHFALTLRTMLWSVLISAPIPSLLAALGYGLQQAWTQPIAVATGEGINATLPLLWFCMIGACFSHPNGLFISQFRWSAERVSRVFNYYRLAIWFIIPLLMILIGFEYYQDREFIATLGRFCFLLICVAVFILTISLRHAGIPLYLDKYGSGNNVINFTLWWLLLATPIVAAFAATFGYLATAEALFIRLELSVAIWLVLLLVYHTIYRWMLIQRRKIAFERAKQRRADMLAQRARNNDEENLSTSENISEIEEPVVDLDQISAQSLGLIRSILTMSFLIFFILLWSEIHSAFSFLENIRLWNTTTSVQGIAVLQPITLRSVLIAILILVITLQLVRNLPALLELAILQHLRLQPGSGYAVTTVTKYLIILFGIILGFSMLGIEWAKLQWLVAALGLGLGFGLQEIFANFVSGLIILFEKPIRIGDTVTIRELTGTITRINTRATTLSDWDKKEIIMPNKAFITEQFINWSLTDTITRIILTVPAPTQANSEQVAKLLLKAATESPIALKTPAPEVYLIDLQQGLQIFELRVFAGEMGHRMPIRHDVHQRILTEYRQHNIELPFPPFQVRTDTIRRTHQSVVPPPIKEGSL